MMNKHTMWKMMAAVVLVAMAVASLGLFVNPAAAQGPGGNGRGGNGVGTQNCTQDCTPALDGTGNQYGAQNGAQNGPMAGQNGNGQGTMLRQHSATPGANLPPASALPLSEAAQAALVGVLQDEVDAYATYQAIIDQFGAIRPFTSIQSAEAQHQASLEFMFTRYGLPVPALSPTVSAPQFASTAEACAAGAAAEVANFALYDSWIAQVSDYPDLVQVFTALRDASEFNHLPALERCAG